MDKIMQSKKFLIVLSMVGLYLISAGSSWAVFSFLKEEPTLTTSVQTGQKKTRARIDTSAPKTEICPISGEMFTKAEKNIWETRRPVLAMIENSLEARPLSGLSKADVVYEAVAEGGITRNLAVFHCAGVAEEVKIAPIRSARIYFVNIAAGYGEKPIFLHQGGANRTCSTCPGGIKPASESSPKTDAYAALDKLKWRNGRQGNDMDGGFNIGLPVIVRNQYRLGSEPAAWEHSVVASLDEVYNEAKIRKFEGVIDGINWLEKFTPWKFVEGSPSPTKNATSIKFEFWSNKPDYDVEWKYEETSNSYLRINGGKPQVDLEFDKPQIKASNVIVMFAKEEGPVDSENHMFYQVIGTGKALIFQNGTVIEGTWKKPTQTSKEAFYDKSGKEIGLVKGKTWIEIVPAQNTIDYL